MSYIGKYLPLKNYLELSINTKEDLSYEKIESILEFKLPNSAYVHTAWWSNGGHDHSYSWLNVGWKIDKIELRNKIVFVKNNHSKKENFIQKDSEKKEMKNTSLDEINEKFEKRQKLDNNEKNSNLRFFSWIYDRDHWDRRKKDDNNIKVLTEIIELGLKIFQNKISGGIIDFNNEASMQMQFGMILNTLGKLFESKQSDVFNIELESFFCIDKKFDKSNSNKAKIDIAMCFGNRTAFSTAAIELKYFKKSNHREPNNRYDVFTDISNLEKYKEKYFDICYLLVLTDHEHYVCQKEYNYDTKDFDFRHNREYKSKTKLIYKTKKPYGKPLFLSGDYIFKWNELHLTNNKILYALMLECQ